MLFVIRGPGAECVLRLVVIAGQPGCAGCARDVVSRDVRQPSCSQQQSHGNQPCPAPHARESHLEFRLAPSRARVKPALRPTPCRRYTAGAMFPVSDVIPSRSTPFVTIGLIAVTSFTFLYLLQLDRGQLYSAAHDWGVVPADLTWLALFTSLFLHDGWIHVGGNMLYLWLFGENVEDAMGHGLFLLFYFAAGAAAALVYAGIDPSAPVPLIGASGAVAAVMGAYFMLYPRSQVLTAIFLVLYLEVIEVPAVFFLGMWLLLQLASGLASLGAETAEGASALMAQGAGFAVGATTGVAIRRRKRAWE
jgi:membrane associated rhomboid family serine protease